jgi:uncharacterized protein DUF222
VVHVDAHVLAHRGPEEPDGRCEVEDGPALSRAAALRLTCDAAVVTLLEDHDGMPLDVGRRTRSVPPAIRRALRARDRGCRFPGCSETRFVEAHHMRHWLHGGKTAVANLVELCTFHHRLHHEGGYTVEGTPPDLRFVRPNGDVIERPAQARHACAGDLRRMNQARGLAIDPGTIRSRWIGDRLNLPYVVSVLAAPQGHAPSRAGRCRDGP